MTHLLQSDNNNLIIPGNVYLTTDPLFEVGDRVVIQSKEKRDENYFEVISVASAPLLKKGTFAVVLENVDTLIHHSE